MRRDPTADLFQLIFTGTFESMDRKTSEATAKKYGAAIIPANKLAEVDMVVLGTRAGYDLSDSLIPADC